MLTVIRWSPSFCKPRQHLFCPTDQHKPSPKSCCSKLVPVLLGGIAVLPPNELMDRIETSECLFLFACSYFDSYFLHMIKFLAKQNKQIHCFIINFLYLFCIPHQRHQSDSYKSWNTTRLVHSLLVSFHSLCTVIESTKCFLFPIQKLSVSWSMQTVLLQSQVDGKLHWHPLISSCGHTLFPMFHYRTVPRGLAMTHYVHQPIELPCKGDLSNI